MSIEPRKHAASSPAAGPETERERFLPEELNDVLAHYALGTITGAREYSRGSRRSPKILLETDQGRYILKRRALGRDRPARVTFSHTLLRHLFEKGFCVPRLVYTRDIGDSKLIRQGRVYELFEYVGGGHYDESLEDTAHAGKTLARLHRALYDFQTAWQPGMGGYHNSERVRRGLQQIPATVSSHDSVSGREAELLGLVQELHACYDQSANTVEQLGFAKWKGGLIHGDWHPGNMRFSDAKVRVVLDFDSARRAPLVTDLANGMLQFSLVRGAGDPEQWPEYFDLARLKRFYVGYAKRIRLSKRQRRAIPPLMIESLIAEGVVPIAATGSLGELPGLGVLRMVRKKVRWLERNAASMENWLLD